MYISVLVPSILGNLFVRELSISVISPACEALGVSIVSIERTAPRSRPGSVSSCHLHCLVYVFSGGLEAVLIGHVVDGVDVAISSFVRERSLYSNSFSFGGVLQLPSFLLAYFVLGLEIEAVRSQSVVLVVEAQDVGGVQGVSVLTSGRWRSVHGSNVVVCPGRSQRRSLDGERVLTLCKGR